MSKKLISLGVVAVVAIFAVMFFTTREEQVIYAVTSEFDGKIAIQSWKTKAGLKVIFVESKELPMVDLRFMFDAGSVRDTKGTTGLAYLTNSMLNQGTKAHNVDELADAFSRLGVILSKGIRRDYAFLNLRSLSKEETLDEATTLLTDMFSTPTFNKKAFDRVKAQQLMSIQYKHQQPGLLSVDTAYDMLYAGKYYGLSPDGQEDVLAKLTANDAKTFYQTHYGVDNAVLAIVGDLTLAKAQHLSDKLSGALVKAEPLAPLKKIRLRAKAGMHKVPFNATQQSIVFAAPGIRRDAKDYFPVVVGNYILGGGGGLISRLAVSVREEKGLTYGIYSYFQPLREQGPFFVQLKTRKEKSEHAQEVVEGVLKQFIAEGPTEDELKAAKQYLTGSFPLRTASNIDILRIISKMAYYDLPLNYLDKYQKNVNDVTTEDIKKAFQKHLNSDKMLKVVVG